MPIEFNYYVQHFLIKANGEIAVELIFGVGFEILSSLKRKRRRIGKWHKIKGVELDRVLLTILMLIDFKYIYMMKGFGSIIE